MTREMSNEMRRGLALSQAAAARNLAALATAREQPSAAEDQGKLARKEERTEVGGHDEHALPRLVHRPASKADATDLADKADSAARAALGRAKAAAKRAQEAAAAAARPADRLDEAVPSATVSQRARRLRCQRLPLRESDAQQPDGQGDNDSIAKALDASVRAQESARKAASAARSASARAQKALDATRLSVAAKSALEADSFARAAKEHEGHAEAALADAERYRQIARRADFLADAAHAVVRALAQVERVCRDMDRESRIPGSRVLDPGAESRANRTRIYLDIERRALTAARDVLLPPPASEPDRRTAGEREASWDDTRSAAEIPPEIRDDPQLAYTAACYLVRWREVSFSDRRVCELLDRATVLGFFLQFAKDDPELSTAPDSEGFDALKKRLATEKESRNLQEPTTRKEVDSDAGIQES